MAKPNKPTEKTFQSAFANGLISHGYINRSTSESGDKPTLSHFDRETCLDRELFIRYIYDANKPSTLNAISKQYADKDKEQLASFIIDEYIKAVDANGLDHVLSKGFYINDDAAFHIEVTCPCPAASANLALLTRYKKNIYSFIRECSIDADGTEIVDFCIFRNGILYAMIELKYTKSGQNVKHAIKQWQNDRSIKSRAMQPNVGCLVWFAQDEDEVFFSTNIGEMGFLPFNQGSNKDGDITEIGAGNDLPLGAVYKTAYMYEDILVPPAWDYVVDKMLLSQVRDMPTFPRYHQYNTVREIDEITEPLVENPSLPKITFLTQQAPGAGKTLEIAWSSILLAHKMTLANKAIYDKVIVVTDRIAAVSNIADELVSAGALPAGYVDYAEKGSKSLLDAVKSECRIIISSAQKFLHKGEEVGIYNADRNVRYAVFIDEAHDNTEGKNQGEITDALLGLTRIYESINDENSKAKNNHIDWFAFTATPKPTTLEMFGRKDANGNYFPHTVYSMKQAIEEGFIIDVLDNVYIIDTRHTAEKSVEEDPVYQSKQAKNALQKEAENSWDFIRYERIPLIVEHFRDAVDGYLLGGEEKALVVCNGIENAVKYKQAFDEFCAEQGYDIPALVAFSGTAVVNGEKHTESSLNPGVRGSIGDAFKKATGTDLPRFMFVANKYQQAYDLDKLCAGYICKHIGSDIHLVQTYGRFNRVAFDKNGNKKKTVIVDFSNSWDEICEAFRPFYSTFGKQPETSKSVKEAMGEVIDTGIIEQALFTMFASYIYQAKNGAAPAVLAAMQMQYDLPIDDAYAKFEALSDEDKKTAKKAIKAYRRAFSFQKILDPASVGDAETTMDEFLASLSNKMSGRSERDSFELPSGEVEFVSHSQVVADAVTNGKHFDGSDASMERWIDSHTDELSIDPVDERDWNARSEEKEAKAQEDRAEFLSVIVDEYNANNKGLNVNKGRIGVIMDRVVESLTRDERLRQAALSNDIEDYRKQYYAKAKDYSHSIPIEMMSGDAADIDDIMFFMSLWDTRQDDIVKLMGFHCDGVFYKLRREAVGQ